MANSNPVAVCVGMGVALLASFSLRKNHSHLCRSMRSFSKISTPIKLGMSPSEISTQQQQAALLSKFHPRFLPCVQQMANIQKDKLSSKTITVLQLNILASNLATKSHFPYVIESSLDWNHRRMILIRQLEELDADILCLEELSDYWTFFKSELDERGYDSVYVKRPSIHLSNWSGKKKMDGCGIFYKKDKFELKECESINFHDSHDRVAMLALLKLRHIQQFVLVGCTHLWWNAKKVDHQMKELFELEEEVIRITADVKNKYEQDLSTTLTGMKTLPIIICGDFNNSPESPVYHYMANTFMRKPNVEGLEEEFTSAYAQYKKNLQAFSVDSNDEVVTSDTSEMNEPPHTTVNYRRCWTIDYIWYSNRHMVPRRILDIPSEDILRSEEGPPGWFNRLAMSDSFNRLGRLPTGLHGNHNGIPNSQFGSDHVPLMTEFEFLLSK